MDWAWTAWLGFFIASFAVLERYAIKRGKTTLSRYTWNAFLRWPLIAVIFGMVFGGLAVHFFWHWCPPGSVSAG